MVSWPRWWSWFGFRKATSFTPFSWGEGQTLLREALLVADHNAYHLGQVVTVRRLLAAWPPADV